MHKHNDSSRNVGCFSNHSSVLSLAKTYRLHPTVFTSTVSDFYAAIDSPVSLSCYMLFSNGEFDQLVNKEINPLDYLDGSTFRGDFAAVSFLRKSGVLKTSFDKKAAALETFKQGERDCEGVNLFFSKLQLSSRQIHRDDWFVINSQIRKISRILGDFDIDAMLSACRWGPGSTLSLKGSKVSSSHKFDFECDITRDAYDLFGDVLKQAYPLWENLRTPRFQAGNKVVTVPKNAKTDRTIAIEPGLNIWIQLGIGKQIKRKLRFAGFNLNSDLKNHRGAYLGSVTDLLATIDFKAASDSLSTGLVEFLLPSRWFRVLNAARSSYYTLNGELKRSNKFSTMGNGFTFELESLIFVTLALALCEFHGVSDENVSIFGDDLIIPSVCVDQLSRICKYYGMIVNDKKSFSSGPFRESCGTYYFEGLDVKPIFLKKGLSRLKDAYCLANSIRSYSHDPYLMGCDKRFKRVWSHLVEALPKKLRLFGPLSSGDSTIHGNLSESSPRKHPAGWEGFTFPALPDVSVSTTRETNGLLLARLHTPSRDTSSKNDVPLRAKTRMVFKKNMFVSQWYDYGNWISVP